MLAFFGKDQKNQTITLILLLLGDKGKMSINDIKVLTTYRKPDIIAYIYTCSRTAKELVLDLAVLLSRLHFHL